MNEFCDTRNDIYKTLNICQTDFSELFFSQQNINIIQQKLYNSVKTKYGYMIDKQSSNDFAVIMKGIYNIYYTSNNDIKSEIIKLNNIVVEKCTDMVISNIRMYKQYVQDASNLPTPIDRPVSVTKTNTIENNYFIQP